MTTIAACSIRRVMVADSQWTDGVTRGNFRKVYRHKGALIGVAGEIDAIHEWLARLRADRLTPGDKAMRSVTALRLSEGGIDRWANLDGWFALTEKRWAIGTGADYAIGALMAGATPLKAVRIAITHDAGSGGRARTYRLNARR